jgi:hypothetical protein
MRQVAGPLVALCAEPDRRQRRARKQHPQRRLLVEVRQPGALIAGGESDARDAVHCNSPMGRPRQTPGRGGGRRV